MAETEGEIDAATDDRASPTSIASPVLRLEAKRAMVWVAIVGLTILAIYISQALLVIFGGLVFATMLDGGERLLGRVLPIARGWRLGLVILNGIDTEFYRPDPATEARRSRARPPPYPRSSRPRRSVRSPGSICTVSQSTKAMCAAWPASWSAASAR